MGNGDRSDNSNATGDTVFMNDYGEVALCECGGINVTVGPMTLHIDHSELDDFQELIAAGFELADGAEPRERPPVPDPKPGKMVH